MQIQHIDMSVPVSRDTPDGEDITEQPTSRADADLAAMAHALVQAVQHRSGFNWTAHGRVQRHQQFSREIKGIVKRLASTSAAVVKDRSSREEVRVRIYADTLAMFNALTMAQDVQQARDRVIRQWCWRVAGIFALSGASAVVYFLYG
jgi:hypothetical protein